MRHLIRAVGGEAVGVDEFDRVARVEGREPERLVVHEPHSDAAGLGVEFDDAEVGAMDVDGIVVRTLKDTIADEDFPPASRCLNAIGPRGGGAPTGRIRRDADALESKVFGKLADDSHAVNEPEMHIAPSDVRAIASERSDAIAERVTNLIGAILGELMCAAGANAEWRDFFEVQADEWITQPMNAAGGGIEFLSKTGGFLPTFALPCDVAIFEGICGVGVDGELGETLADINHGKFGDGGSVVIKRKPLNGDGAAGIDAHVNRLATLIERGTGTGEVEVIGVCNADGHRLEAIGVAIGVGDLIRFAVGVLGVEIVAPRREVHADGSFGSAGALEIERVMEGAGGDDLHAVAGAKFRLLERDKTPPRLSFGGASAGVVAFGRIDKVVSGTGRIREKRKEDERGKFHVVEKIYARFRQKLPPYVFSSCSRPATSFPISSVAGSRDTLSTTSPTSFRSQMEWPDACGGLMNPRDDKDF